MNIGIFRKFGEKNQKKTENTETMILKFYDLFEVANVRFNFGS